MSNKARAEKEREKVTQQKVQAILGGMLKEEDNKYCVDCDSKGPRWASWNLGIFLCIRCAGIHRNLGVHISRVKSVNLDSWTPQQVASMQAMGNSKARAIYEANLPDNYRRPQNDQAMEAFIRQKYEKKKYIAAEWVPTKPPDFPVGWNDSGPVQEKKPEFKKLQLPPKISSASSPVTTSSSPRPEVKTETKPSPAPAPRAAPATSLDSDLLGLSLSSGPALAQPPPPANTSSADLLGLNSEFDAFVSASPLPSSATPASVPAPDTFITESPAASGSVGDGKMSVDSIMALFGPKSSPAPSQSFSPLGGQVGGFPGQVAGGMFPPHQPGLPVQPSAFNMVPGASSQQTNLFSDLYKPQQSNNNKEMTNNPFLDTNQLSGLNFGNVAPASSSSLWQ